MMDISLIKLVGASLLWSCIMVFGILPIKIKRFRTNKMLLSLSNCFSGGLFISIGLIHILPEARENLEGKIEKSSNEDTYIFPLSYVISLATFSFILLIDKVIFSNEELAEHDNDGHINLNNSLFKHKIEDRDDPEENFKELVSSSYKVALKLSKTREHHSLLDHGEYQKMIDKKDSIISEVEYLNPVRSDILVKEPEVVFMNKSHNSGNKDDNDNILNNNIDSDRHHHINHNTNLDYYNHNHATIKASDSNLTAYIILLAMGIHGLFAGIAFGLAKTKIDAVNMFIAMIAHKWSEALSVGVSFVSAEIDPNKSVKMICFLANITPVGILIGYLLSNLNDFVVGVALAISAGTFLYISCAEIIVEEFSISRHKFLKFVFYAFGIFFIIFVGTLEA